MRKLEWRKRVPEWAAPYYEGETAGTRHVATVRHDARTGSGPYQSTHVASLVHAPTGKVMERVVVWQGPVRQSYEEASRDLEAYVGQPASSPAPIASPGQATP